MRLLLILILCYFNACTEQGQAAVQVSTEGEDPNFDQLLSSLSSVVENCLPSLLHALFEWYDRQYPYDDLNNLVHKYSAKTKGSVSHGN